ncbi:hypothetical protein TCAL_06553 [Tigriopus californicus]|uniref:Methyltransferase FkbM domain-containing protein n=1 Tax=Tigriopus californicus TaxID=6832 RepID=A0A553PQK7_TIGCA|nr:uncharacterized protein LOC131881996 [Tigriopus californicus]TRY79951.1 hypothetical protein TCAL_06553 [Tigriopus californicus]
MLQAYGKDSILLDVGANIGSHLLFAAAKGHSVWGVEPQTINLVKMYQAALMDATNSRITFLQNTLDKDYLKVYIKQTLGNIGGSYVMNEAGGDSSLEQIQSVLLSDVIKHIQFNKRQTENLTIIMKVDIESYECRAFLGSPLVLNSTHSGFYIPYVVMEWTYAQGKQPPYKYPAACPRKSVVHMTNLFTANGYIPFSKNRIMLNPNTSDTWKADVIWQHKNAHQLFFDKGRYLLRQTTQTKREDAR